MMVPAHVAAEDALEWFFDHNIAKQFTDKEESSDQEEEEEKEVKEEEQKEVEEEEQKEVEEEEQKEVKEEEQKEVKEEAQKEEEKEVKAPGEQPHPEACKKEDSSSQNAPAEPELQIRNVMCSSSLNCSLDTQLIARMGRNAEYVRKVRIRIRSPRATALISTDGRMMSSGADSVGGAHRAARRLARIVQKLGFPVCFSSFKVHNFMVMFHTFPLSLERLYVALWGHCSYEPELFTGLFYYSGRITACVRHTGDVSLTGSSEVAELTAVFRRLFPTLLQTRSRSSV